MRPKARIRDSSVSSTTLMPVTPTFTATKTAPEPDERRQHRVELVGAAVDEHDGQCGIAGAQRENESRDREPPRVIPVDGADPLLPRPPAARVVAA